MESREEREELETAFFFFLEAVKENRDILFG